MDKDYVIMEWKLVNVRRGVDLWNQRFTVRTYELPDGAILRLVQWKHTPKVLEVLDMPRHWVDDRD